MLPALPVELMSVFVLPQVDLNRNFWTPSFSYGGDSAVMLNAQGRGNFRLEDIMMWDSL
jgi:hypothetical protein